MLDFTVVAPSKLSPDPKIGASLQQDFWNDFNFQTLYHLYVFTSEFNGLIGPVKILRRGQTPNHTHQLKLGALGSLDNDYCSLGQSLDYYERLADLPATLRQQILEHLRDALIFPDATKSFFDEPGWTSSVLQFIDWESFRHDAWAVLQKAYSGVAQLELKFTFRVKGWANPLVIEFAAPIASMASSEITGLPERVAVLTGRNGSGKSTLLARLARVLHASQRERMSNTLMSLGSIEPPGIGFTRVLNISYSAFDAFLIPGLDRKERQQIAIDLKRGTGRYYFCGLRDIVREIEDGLNETETNEISAEDIVFLDRQHRTHLKSIDQLTGEFIRTTDRIKEIGRNDMFHQVVGVLASDPSFRDLGADPGSKILHTAGPFFDRWSTGHKIVMHATASMVAYMEAKSIILIDEPESHLHPPLLAAFMHALRLILAKNDSFAVVATHSPVVAQETLGCHVSVVRRIDSETTIHPPRIETYGESIGEITDEVFGLNSDATDFHKTLQGLVKAGMPLQSIEQLFERGLSLQARAYVMSELAQKD